jgi:superfamily I DNA/RNA helicase
MTIKAFTGGAGCGKTFQLIAAIETGLQIEPLQPHQKILALTYMHGSRKRLEEKLSKVNLFKKKFNCSTIDSFCWRLLCRWRSLAVDIGVEELSNVDYDLICEAAGKLLKHEIVAKWVSRTFPIVLLDEAQDLTPDRLSIFSALEPYVKLFVAADEFQCLDENLNPNPAYEWLQHSDDITELTIPQRTNVADLLNAASAIRRGESPVAGNSFKVAKGFSVGLAGSWLSNEISWYRKGGSVAILSPVNGIYMKRVIEWATTKKTSKQNGPHNIKYEMSEQNSTNNFFAKITIPSIVAVENIQNIIAPGGDSSIEKDVKGWIRKKIISLGVSNISKEELEEFIRGSFSRRKMIRSIDEIGVAAMSVHAAKNREFDNVIILWPAAVQGSDNQKRRLLYNAVTRAKKRCLVIVQSQKALSLAPFV